MFIYNTIIILLLLTSIILVVIKLYQDYSRTSGSGPSPPSPPSPSPPSPPCPNPPCPSPPSPPCPNPPCPSPPSPPSPSQSCPPICPLNDSYPEVSWNSFPNYGKSPKPIKNKGFKLSEFTPDKWDKDKKILASTTNFSFGGDTSCACNGNELTEKLAEIGYIGVATPDWLQTPFNTQQTGNAAGGEVPSMLIGTKYVSNCSSGPSGCGKCFELTVKDREIPPLYNVKKPDGTTNSQQNPVKLKKGTEEKIKVVNLDTCEDRNAYGPNWQWCNAAKDIKPTDTFNFSGNVPPKEWGEKLRFGRFFTDSNLENSIWVPPSDCIDTDGNWVCTNLAGAPIHFDFGVAGLLKSDPNNLLNTINPNIDWSTWNNPIVHARPIECDSKVNDILKSKCGANASNPPNIQTCMYYCKPFNKKPGDKNEIPNWWGGCDNNWSCAEANKQCGGKGYKGPTCCQWGQICNKFNESYSGCKDK